MPTRRHPLRRLGVPSYAGEAAAKAAAFDDLYDATISSVWAALRRLGVAPSNLEDAVQDVYLAMYRRMSDFEARSSNKAWAYGFAVRVARDHHRRARRKDRGVELSADLAAPSEGGPHAALEHAEAGRLLDELLDELTPERREVFVLVDIEGFTAVEVAELTSTKLNTVYSRLRLARQDFERRLATRRSHD